MCVVYIYTYINIFSRFIKLRLSFCLCKKSDHLYFSAVLEKMLCSLCLEYFVVYFTLVSFTLGLMFLDKKYIVQ